jgi:hypothetical protein
MPTYESVDFYKCDGLLSNEERAVRAGIAREAEQRRGPLYAAWSRVKVEVKLPLPNGTYTLTRFDLSSGGKPEASTVTASGGLKAMLSSTPIIVEAR